MTLPGSNGQLDRIPAPDSARDAERIVPELRERLADACGEAPPVRTRREDTAALLRRLLADVCFEQGVPSKQLSTQAAALLGALLWRHDSPGLRAFLAALAGNVSGRMIRLADVLVRVRIDGPPTAFVYTGTLRQARERFERDYVASVLEQHRGRMAEAAKALGIQRTNLYRKVRELSVTRRSARRNNPESV
jgi:two-component system nitrogen regulation response regulator NtrX